MVSSIIMVFAITALPNASSVLEDLIIVQSARMDFIRLVTQVFATLAPNTAQTAKMPTPATAARRVITFQEKFASNARQATALIAIL